MKRARKRLLYAARESGRHAVQSAIHRWLSVELPRSLEGRATTARLLGKHDEARELRMFACHASEIAAMLRRGDHWSDLQAGALREMLELEEIMAGGEE